MKKRCPRCKKYKSSEFFHKSARRYDGLQGKCKQCQNEMYRLRRATSESVRKAYYEKSQRYIKKYPERQQARMFVSQALKEGVLIKKPCEVCFESKVHAHHPDWSEPLNVVWLCPSHHKAAHVSLC